MPVTITHSTPADGTFSATGAAAWDATHTVSGLGTMAEQNANNVNITGGSITGVTGVLSSLTVNSTPTSGGAAGQIMFDTGSVLQESSNLVWDNTNKKLTITGATVTTSQPVLDMTQTWNAAGTTFTGLKFNVTNTASNAASLLMDLQVGGVSRFNVKNNGLLYVAGYTGSGNAILTGYNGTYVDGQFVVFTNELGIISNMNVVAGALNKQDTSKPSWYFSARSATIYDDFNVGSAVANSTSFSQYFRVTRSGISTVSGNFIGIGSVDVNGGIVADAFLTRRGAANLRFGAADAAAPVAQTLSVQSVVAGTSNTAGANLTITGSQGTGTGVGGDIVFQTAPAGTSGTAQNAFINALKINSNGSISGNAGNTFGIIYVQGNSTTFNDSGLSLDQTGVALRSTGAFSWTSAANGLLANRDTFLTRRGAANLRFGNADAAAPVAQTLSVQSVVAGTSNTAGANLTITGSQGTGTGAGGSIIFQTAPAGSTGTAQNALATALIINSDRTISATAGTNAAITYGAQGLTSGFTIIDSTFTGIISNGQYALYVSRGIAGSIRTRGDGSFAWGTSNATDAADLILSRRGAANLRLGNTDAAAPVAQTLSVQSVVAGTSDTAGANLTITGSQGTGTGAGGSIIFQTAPAGSTGTAQNALQNSVTIDQNSNILVQSYSNSISSGLGFKRNADVAYNLIFGLSTGNYPYIRFGDAAGGAFITRKGTGNLRFGDADAAAPVAQTLSVQSVVAGTSNTAGANLTITGSQGTGTGAGGSIIFQVAPAGSSGTAQNALVSALTINSAGQVLRGSPTSTIISQNAGLIVSGAISATVPAFQITSEETTTNSNAGGGSMAVVANPAAAMLSGSRLGAFAFGGSSSSSAIRYAATLQAFANQNWVDASAYGSRFELATTANGSTTRTTRLIVGNSGIITFGATEANTVPALKPSSTILQVRLADDSAYAPVEASTVRTATAYTVATLPAAGTAGRMAYVTDATAPTYLGALTGGGTVVCPVFDNGTAWVSC